MFTRLLLPACPICRACRARTAFPVSRYALVAGNGSLVGYALDLDLRAGNGSFLMGEKGGYYDTPPVESIINNQGRGKMSGWTTLAPVFGALWVLTAVAL